MFTIDVILRLNISFRSLLMFLVIGVVEYLADKHLLLEMKHFGQ